MTALRELPVNPDPAAGYDALGRKFPHRLHFMVFARQFPGFAAQFTKRVPDQFVAKVDRDAFDVACPCGHTPRLRELGLAECNCGRVFALTAGEVRVAYPLNGD